ncbi:protoporphyrinogen/coproporphyrinogen oxidase [Nocardia anaemiae]|uniref:protoporphyrinogen/coproporphyrinogen oxidase n=1 Tax=Nocardia anaemiae TaxID=263910 RepID=UPI000A05FE22|nr:FAD-dependent oxidoreductase [Nocardia anaemiae]
MENPKTADRRLAVVGAGIAGMTAALHLQKAGYEVELIEQMEVLGGRFGVDRLGERPVMTGGKNLGRKYRALREFLAEFGEPEYEEFGINTSRVLDGEILTLDSKQSAWDKISRLRRLGPVRDLLKLAYLGFLVRRKEENRFLGSAAFTRIADRKDDRPLSAHFSPRIVRNMFRPMNVRMNGAEPDEVYLGTFGTNLNMIMDTYDQLTHGISPIIDELSKVVRVRTSTKVEQLLIRDGRVVGLGISEHGGPLTDHYYDGVVLASPAYASAEIVKSELPALSDLLAEVKYFPAAVVLVEYDRPVFGSEVRAIVLDDGPCSNAGVYGINDLHIVRYTFSGRQARPTPTDTVLDQWIDDAEHRLTRLLGVEHVNRVHTVKRIWDAAYCAYVPFHGKFLSQVHSEVAATPGLELAGDYLRGAPLEASCRSGLEAADKLLNQLKSAVPA